MGLFGNKKVVEKIINSAISGVDKMFFTNEEKSEVNNKLADSVAEFAKSTLNENTARSKSRRLIAFLVVFTFLGLLVGSGVFSALNAQPVADTWYGLAGQLSNLVLIVVVFYFGGYYADNFTHLRKKKKDKNV